MIPRWREPLLRRLERSKAAQLQSVSGGPLESEERPRRLPWRPLALQLLFVLCRFAGFWCSVQAFGIRSRHHSPGSQHLGWPMPLGWWSPVPLVVWGL